MMGPSGQCFIPNFNAIDLLVPEKKTFEEFLPYCHGGNLDHETRTI